MEELIEVRKKTGLSQYNMAEYLGVSRSLISLVEQGLRELPMAAHQKVMDMILELTKDQDKARPAAITEKDKKADIKLDAYHKKKMADHQYQAIRLQRRLLKMQQHHGQANTRLTLVNKLTETDQRQVRKTTVDNKWLEYYGYTTRKHIVKKETDLKMIEVSITMQLGYAAVHEKILKEFFSA